MDYFIIIDGKQVGPLPQEQLIDAGLTKSTNVWREGMTEWVAAENLAELDSLFQTVNSADTDRPGSETQTPPPPPGASAEEAPRWFVLTDDVQEGPLTFSELSGKGLTKNTMVWKEGWPEWRVAGEVDELGPVFAEQSNGYQYGRQPYGQTLNQMFENSGYSGGDSGYFIPRKSKWMIWAIVSSAVNFFLTAGVYFPIIGLVCGIVGIVYANKANECYQMRNDAAGDNNDSTARILTIISICVAGLSILCGIILLIFGLTMFSALMDSMP